MLLGSRPQHALGACCSQPPVLILPGRWWHKQLRKAGWQTKTCQGRAQLHVVAAGETAWQSSATARPALPCNQGAVTHVPAEMHACCSASGTGRPALRRYCPLAPPWSCCGQLCVLLLQRARGLLQMSSPLLLHHSCGGSCTVVMQCPGAAPQCKLEEAVSRICSTFGNTLAQTSRCSTACSQQMLLCWCSATPGAQGRKRDLSQQGHAPAEGLWLRQAFLHGGWRGTFHLCWHWYAARLGQGAANPGCQQGVWLGLLALPLHQAGRRGLHA